MYLDMLRYSLSFILFILVPEPVIIDQKYIYITILYYYNITRIVNVSSYV